MRFFLQQNASEVSDRRRPCFRGRTPKAPSKHFPGLSRNSQSSHQEIAQIAIWRNFEKSSEVPSLWIQVSKNSFFINRIIIGDLVTHVGLWHDENVGSKIIYFPSKCNFCSTPRINSYLQPVFDGCPQNHPWTKRKWSLCKFFAQIVFEIEFLVISLICSQLTNKKLHWLRFSKNSWQNSWHEMTRG